MMKFGKLLTRAITPCLISFASPAHGAAINVQSTSDDTVGSQLVYAIKNKIAQSAIHREVNTPDDAAFIVYIVTIKADEAESSTSYSMIITMKDFKYPHGMPYYITNFVGNCGVAVIDSCASAAVARIDQNIQPIIQEYDEEIKKSQPSPSSK